MYNGMAKLVLLLLLQSWVGCQQLRQQGVYAVDNTLPLSPCPSVFSYEGREAERDRWYGVVLVNTDLPLTGLRLDVRLSKPARLLGNWDGEVTTQDNTRFTILNLDKYIAPGPPTSVRIFVVFGENEEIPYVKAIALNGRQICPADPLTAALVLMTTPQRNALPMISTTPFKFDTNYQTTSTQRPSYSEYDTPTKRTTSYNIYDTPPTRRTTSYIEYEMPSTHTTANYNVYDTPSTRRTTTTQRYNNNNYNEFQNSITQRSTTRDPFEYNEYQTRPTRRPDPNYNSGFQETSTRRPQPDNINSNNNNGYQTQISTRKPQPDSISDNDNNNEFQKSTTQRSKPMGSNSNNNNGYQTSTTTRKPTTRRPEPRPEYSNNRNGAENPVNRRTTTTEAAAIVNVVERFDSQNMPQNQPSNSANKFGNNAANQNPGNNKATKNKNTSTRRPTMTAPDQQAEWVTTEKYSARPTTRRPLSEVEDLTRPPSSECGRVHISATPLITHGQTTSRGQWPWHVAVYQSKGKDLTYICGGSLISSNVVVTAAHCVTKRVGDYGVDPDTLVVYLGKYHLKLWSEGGVQDKQVRNIHIHPLFNSSDFRADVAVLILSSAVDLTQFVRPICLWGHRDVDLRDLEGQEGIVVGWGYDEYGQVTEDLSMAKMPVVSQQTCLWSYPEFFSHFTSNMTFCAGFVNGTSVCNGDSGGGMVFPQRLSDGSKLWRLRGLVSISVSKEDQRVCDTSHYVVFTDLAKYQDWISNYIK